MDRLSTSSPYLSPFFLFFAYSLPLVASHEESARPYIPHTYSARSSTIPPGTIVSVFPPPCSSSPFFQFFLSIIIPLSSHLALSDDTSCFLFGFTHSLFFFLSSSLFLLFFKTNNHCGNILPLIGLSFFLLCRSFPSSVFFYLNKTKSRIKCISRDDRPWNPSTHLSRARTRGYQQGSPSPSPRMLSPCRLLIHLDGPHDTKARWQQSCSCSWTLRVIVISQVDNDTLSSTCRI